MLTKEEILIISECAKKHNVSEVLLFGSALEENTEYRDIDIAIKGIDSRIFFRFYGDLIKKLNKPVDVINLTKKTTFNEMIENEGVRIYG